MRHRITPASHKTSPVSPVSLSPTPDPYAVACVLADLDAVPRSELPDGGARDALAQAIRAGVVDAVYQPAAAHYHNLTLAIVEPHEEPRRLVTDWIAAWDMSHKWHSATLAVWARDVASAAAEGGKA